MTLLPVLKPVLRYPLSSPLAGGGAYAPLDFLPPSLRTGGFAVNISRLFGSYSGPLAVLRRGVDSVQQNGGLGARVTSAEVTGFVGKNLVAWSEDLTQWQVPEGVTPSATSLVESVATSRHRVRQPYNAIAGMAYTIRCRAKSNNRNLVINTSSAGGMQAGFDLTAGTVVSAIYGSAAISRLGNGWYLCTVTGTAGVTGSVLASIQMQVGTTDASYAGDGVSSLDVTEIQLEYGSTATAYEPRPSTGASPCLAPKLFDQLGSFYAEQNTGTMQPQIIPRQIGEKGVVSFDGIDDFFDCGTAVGDYTNNFTISAWIKTPGSVAVNPKICNRRVGANTQYDFYILKTSGVLGFYDGTNVRQTVATVISNTWRHVAVVVSGGNVQFYIDGVASGSPQAVTITSFPANPYWIGRWSSDYFVGSMGHHMVLGNALTATQILQIYNATKGEYGL